MPPRNTNCPQTNKHARTGEPSMTSPPLSSVKRASEPCCHSGERGSAWHIAQKYNSKYCRATRHPGPTKHAADAFVQNVLATQRQSAQSARKASSAGITHHKPGLIAILSGLWWTEEFYDKPISKYASSRTRVPGGGGARFQTLIDGFEFHMQMRCHGRVDQTFRLKRSTCRERVDARALAAGSRVSGPRGR